MSSNDFLIQLVSEFASAFDPLVDALESVEGFDFFLGEFGWELQAGASIEQVEKITDDLPGVISKIQPLSERLLQALNDQKAPDIKDFDQLVELVKQIVHLVNKLNQNPVEELEPFINREFQTTFPDELLGYLVYNYVEKRTPRFFGLLFLIGVFYQPEPDPSRPVKYTPRQTRWSMLATFASAPQDVMKVVYDWGKAEFGNSMSVKPGHLRLVEALGKLFASFKLPVVEDQPSDVDLDAYYDHSSQFRSNILKLYALLASKLIDNEPELSIATLGLSVLPVPPKNQNSEAPDGISIYPSIEGKLDAASIPITDNVKVALRGGFESAGGIRLEIYPGAAKISTGLQVSLNAETRLTAERSLDDPWILAGRKESTHLWMAKAHLSIQVHGIESDVEVVIEGALDSAAFVLDFRDADGFLNSLFGDKPQVINMPIMVSWSSHRGLTISGKAALEFNISLHQSIGDVIHLETLIVSMQAKGPDSQSKQPVQIQLAMTGGIQLGPLTASVDRVGVEANLDFPSDGGSLGAANLKLGFKPPDGAGLVIDAGAVVGGGYLFFDNDKGQYGGALQLQVQVVAVKAIGLITTKMPDGSPGFSFLIIITVEFSPIQLGYGFTLNGVGGLAGFNRTMMVDALRDGIKNRTLDSIMFPPDPVANAQKIISDLQTVFPASPGRFIFAPMVKLGWGASILLIEIGLAVELPSPLRLAIMGKLHLKLPPLQQDEDAEESKTLVEMHLDVLGILDFDKHEVSVDAVLYNSRITLFPVSGGMALRLRWGNDPLLVLAIGGLNPRFPPPPRFPDVDRMAFQLDYSGDGVHALMRMESYLGMTPNSLQFGARIEINAEVSEAQVSGYLGFDALMEPLPLKFIVDLFGGVVVKAFGLKFAVDMLLTLTGPRPFEGDGHVTIEFLGKHEFPIHFIVDQTEVVPALIQVNPLEPLKVALEDQRSWSAVLPPDGSQLVTLRQLSADEMKDKVLAHPLGDLEVRQTVLPLGLPLERFGAGIPTSPGPFAVSRFILSGLSINPESGKFTLKDAFARGQFVNLTEDQKLTTPGFEPFTCGISHIGTNAFFYEIGAKQEPVFEYEVTIIDDKDGVQKRTSRKDEIKGLILSLSQDAMYRSAQYGAAALTPMKSMGSARFAGPSQGIKVGGQKYALANKDDFKRPNDIIYDTFSEAEIARTALGNEFQVVEVQELA